MSNKKTEMIDYEVIVKATKGDAISINTILNKYEPYINRLATVDVYDEYGNPYCYINDDFKKILQTKLIAAILKFRPN